MLFKVVAGDEPFVIAQFVILIPVIMYPSLVDYDLAYFEGRNHASLVKQDSSFEIFSLRHLVFQQLVQDTGFCLV